MISIRTLFIINNVATLIRQVIRIQLHLFPKHNAEEIQEICYLQSSECIFENNKRPIILRVIN